MLDAILDDEEHAQADESREPAVLARVREDDRRRGDAGDDGDEADAAAHQGRPTPIPTPRR